MLKDIKDGWKYTKTKYKIKSGDVFAILATVAMLILLALLYW